MIYWYSYYWHILLFIFDIEIDIVDKLLPEYQYGVSVLSIQKLQLAHLSWHPPARNSRAHNTSMHMVCWNSHAQKHVTELGNRHEYETTRILVYTQQSYGSRRHRGMNLCLLPGVRCIDRIGQNLINEASEYMSWPSSALYTPTFQYAPPPPPARPTKCYQTTPYEPEKFARIRPP